MSSPLFPQLAPIGKIEKKVSGASPLWRKTSYAKTLEPQRDPYLCALDGRISPKKIKWKEATKNGGNG
ncbi:unnamed protein product [Prunus armeniaca]